MVEAVGAQGKSEYYLFDPEDLVIVEDEENATYDERWKLNTFEPLVRSIMLNGFIGSIEVRKNGKNDKGAFICEVVAGRQRVKAAREANRRLLEAGKDPVRVRAIFVTVQSDADLFGHTIAENAPGLRQNETPVGLAKKLARLLTLGRSQEECMANFGWTARATYEKYLCLMECTETVQRLVDQKKIPLSKVVELSTLSKDEQDKFVKELEQSGAIEDRKDVAQAVEETAEKKNGKPKKRAGGLRIKSRKVLEAIRKDFANEVDEDDETPDDHPLRIASAVVSWTLGDATAFDDYPEVKRFFPTEEKKKVKGKKDKSEKNGSAKTEKAEKAAGKKGRKKKEVEDIDAVLPVNLKKRS